MFLFPQENPYVQNVPSDFRFHVFLPKLCQCFFFNPSQEFFWGNMGHTQNRFPVEKKTLLKQLFFLTVFIAIMKL